jgi:hypothetical protein
MKMNKPISAFITMSACFVALAGCQKESPAEKAGEKIQDASKGDKRK